MNNFFAQIPLYSAIKVILLLIIIRLLYPNNVFSQIHSPIRLLDYQNNLFSPLNKEKKNLSPTQHSPLVNNIIQNTSVSISAGLPLRYTRDNTSSQQPLPLVYNISSSVNARYSYQNFFLDISMMKFAYKQPWNPDFTYTLSYSVPLSYGSINLSYQNYNGTRYPWRKNHRNFLALKDGSIGIAFSTNLNDLFYKTKLKN